MNFRSNDCIHNSDTRYVSQTLTHAENIRPEYVCKRYYYHMPYTYRTKTQGKFFFSIWYAFDEVKHDNANLIFPVHVLAFFCHGYVDF